MIRKGPSRKVEIPLAGVGPGGMEAGDLQITATAQPPSFDDIEPGEMGLRTMRQWYAARADTLIRALEEHCPGGLMDALLAGLLQRKAVVYRVADFVLGRETGRWVRVEQALPEPTDRPILVQLLDGTQTTSRGFKVPTPGTFNGGWNCESSNAIHARVVRWYSAEPSPPVTDADLPRGPQPRPGAPLPPERGMKGAAVISKERQGEGTVHYMIGPQRRYAEEATRDLAWFEGGKPETPTPEMTTPEATPTATADESSIRECAQYRGHDNVEAVFIVRVDTGRPGVGVIRHSRPVPLEYETPGVGMTNERLDQARRLFAKMVAADIRAGAI